MTNEAELFAAMPCARGNHAKESEMFRNDKCVRAIVFALLAALITTSAARAASPDELKELREQVRQLRELYERRIDALEKRLQQAELTVGKAEAGAGKALESASKAEAVAGKAEASAGKAESAVGTAAALASTRTTGESALNPAISLILNSTYGNLRRDPASYRINGFAPTGGEVAPVGRGLSLAASELVMSANIDPNFRGTLIAKLGADDTVAVEEAFIQTLGLTRGFTARAGRFLANVGYLNTFHPHAWDFADAPLTNKVFLGNQLGEDGVQIRWVAPTDLYVDLGMEIGRGRKFPGGPDGGRNKNGFGAGNLFANLGGDIGASSAWQLGLSHLRTRPQDRTYEDPDFTGTNVTNSFSGTSRLWALSGVFKWAPNGNSRINNFKLQGEYFRRNEEGILAYDTGGASQSGAFSSRQSGWYAQGLYQFAQGWRTAYRFDKLSAGTAHLGLVSSGPLVAADFPILAGYSPTRRTWMIDWSGTEFSRVRLQLAHDKSRLGAPDTQVVLQYIMSLGAHGAHRF